MRLLQLAVGPGELIDLHPNVSVVTDLDDAGRRRLTEAVSALARGTATGDTGLLEAHGVLFELSSDLLALLDIDAGELRPVVTAGDLPFAQDPGARARIAAERALAAVAGRRATAAEELVAVEAAVELATEALERAERAVKEAEADAAGRIRSVDALAADLDHAVERRRQLTEERDRRRPEAEAASAARADVESATTDVRAARDAAVARRTAVSARLDDLRAALDVGADAALAEATAALADVQAAVEAEREAERLALEASDDEEPPAERLSRVQLLIEDLDKRLAAFGPADIHEVANALDHLRSVEHGDLVAHPAAIALADQLAELDEGLVATSSGGVTPGGLAAGRARLDDARQALLEAEQAVRNPELDRGLVDRLETAHAALLDAIDRANARFGGARAQRRVDALRSEEDAILGEMGFTSYSDYMMGYSLLHVDPEKEAALEAARLELTAAEDAWRTLQAETDAELERAEALERRRSLIEEARALLDRPVSASAAVEELRALRVAPEVPPAIVDRLARALDEAGVAIGDEALDREDLVVVADAWLAEAGEAAAREQELRAERVRLDDERMQALAAVEAAGPSSEGPSAEAQRRARVAAATEALSAAEARHRSHRDAEASVSAAEQELAAALEAEDAASRAAADADEAVAAAVRRDEDVRSDLVRIEAELAEAVRAEAEGNELLRAHREGEVTTPEELAELVRQAAAALAAQQEAAARAEQALRALEAEHEAAGALVESTRDQAGVIDDTSMAEEIEWYLLARLAAQRAVSLAGSLPLLLDDALAGLAEDELAHVLGRLERMAEAVQVIILSDDDLAASWALEAGPGRAAVVRPQAASTV